MGGSSTVPGFNEGQPGVYGTLGTPAAANLPGGRMNAVTWTDKSGHFWLFGGLYYGITAPAGVLNDLWEFNPSTNQWTWMSGSNTIGNNSSDGGYVGQPGMYGTLGAPAAANVPGGRSSAATWIDNAGNLWLFGGEGIDSAGNYGELNDLWEFNPNSNQWTWMGGGTTVPGLLEGRNGIYGQLGTPAAGNVPGGRWGAVSWTDSSGNLWLFGGNGYDASSINGGPLNDLWEFSLSTNQWAWMGGSSKVDASGVYGTLGTPATGNVPGGRESAVSWIDCNGNLWLFGGHGFDSVGALGWLNDLWEFQPSMSEWAWKGGGQALTGWNVMTGNTFPGNYGVYGTLQVPSAGNIPGGREGAVSWTDKQGNFWLFGGYGYDSVGDFDDLNDLWEFSPSTNEWAWIGGNDILTLNQVPPGQYGTLQIPAFGNTPGGREDAVSWADSKGDLWLFGGYGPDSTDTWGELNELWEFQITTGGLPVTATPTISLATGTYTSIQTADISDTTPGATIYYLINGSTPAVEYMGEITVSSSETIEAMAGASGYANSAVAAATYTVNLPLTATPTFSVPAGSYASPQTVIISDTTPGAIIYYTTSGTPTTSSPVYSGQITVSTSDTITAIAVAYGYTNSQPASVKYTIQPTSALGVWAWMSGSSTIPTCSSPGQTCAIPGVYGTLGIPAAANTPSGRAYSATWTDKSGNLWLFGGEGFDTAGTYDDAQLNDLWEFTVSTGEWAWMGGSNTVGPPNYGFPGVYGTLGTPAASNIPGGRALANTWTDPSGNFWLFGGAGIDSAGVYNGLNDLWKFNPSTMKWTWMSGSSVAGPAGCQQTNTCGQPGVYGTLGTPAVGNVPGGRQSAVSWTDKSGNLWLFGGSGYDSTGTEGWLNDLWEFNPTSNEWTWMSGSNILVGLTGPTVIYGQMGVYGTMGVSAPANIPGTRGSAVGWADASGNLWLFGGWGFDYRGFWGYLNDLWEFNPSTKEWTWMGGSDSASAGGSEIPVYGEEGTPAATNVPGARSGASGTTSNSGYFWLFGGSGFGSGGLIGYLDDFWVFNPATDEWTWTGGNNDPGQSGIFGPEGTFGATNIIGSRAGASSWTDSMGNIWLFGGNSYSDFFNDLWEYQPNALTSPAKITPALMVTPGSFSITTAQPLTVTVVISGTPPPTGSLKLSGGGYSSTQNLSGDSTQFTITAGSLNAGSFTFTASYTPDTNSSLTYNSATGTSQQVTVTTAVPPSFTIAGTPVTVEPGSTTGNTSTITVTPSGGFTGSVALTAAITSSPASAQYLPTLSFGSTTPVSITGSNFRTATLTISTTAASSASLVKPIHRGFPWYTEGGAALACILLIGIPAQRRGWRTMLGMLALLVTLTGGVLACGGGGGGSTGSGGNSNPGTTGGTYTITVTGISGTTTATGLVTLNVQ
jgi:N-acetylneuraminic acid mutarotase